MEALRRKGKKVRIRVGQKFFTHQTAAGNNGKVSNKEQRMQDSGSKSLSGSSATGDGESLFGAGERALQTKVRWFNSHSMRPKRRQKTSGASNLCITVINWTGWTTRTPARHRAAGALTLTHWPPADEVPQPWVPAQVPARLGGRGGVHPRGTRYCSGRPEPLPRAPQFHFQRMRGASAAREPLEMPHPPATFSLTSIERGRHDLGAADWRGVRDIPCARAA